MELNLEIQRGEVVDWPLSFISRIAGHDKGLDLSAATIRFTVKTDPDAPDEEAVLHKDIAPAEHLDAAAGRSRLTLSPEETDVPPGVYVFELVLVEAGRLLVLVVGKLRINGAVS